MSDTPVLLNFWITGTSASRELLYLINFCIKWTSVSDELCIPLNFCIPWSFLSMSFAFSYTLRYLMQELLYPINFCIYLHFCILVHAFLFLNHCLFYGLLNQWHFGMDPDSRIRISHKHIQMWTRVAKNIQIQIRSGTLVQLHLSSNIKNTDATKK